MIGKHLFGIYEKAMPDTMTLKEKFMLARELGFEYVEISVDESDEKISRLYLSESRQTELALELISTGLLPQSLCLSANRRFPLGSADVQRREKAAEIIERAILFARRLGIRVIQLAGYDVYYEASTQESRRLFLQGLCEACRIAERYQVMLAMEIMDTELVSSISRYMYYSEQLGSPWFTVYPDMGNLSVWCGKEVSEQLRLGGKEIVAMHIKETKAPCGGEPACFKRVPFGTGCVDFSGIFELMESINYTGPYTLEMWYEEGRCAKDEIASARQFVFDKFSR